MRAKIIRIGNSQGIRIPKPLLEQTGLGEHVELEVRADEIVIRSPRSVRSGWANSFEKMSQAGDDALLEDDVATEWDKEEWEW